MKVTKHPNTYTFEESDFDGSGQYLIRTLKYPIKDDGYLVTVASKVGYIKQPIDCCCLISMSDGWTRCGDYVMMEGDEKPGTFTLWNNIQELVASLNSDGYWRPATKDEMKRIVSYGSRRAFEELPKPKKK